MHAVSKAILDVAFSDEQPPIALNIVHPKPDEWSTVMGDVRNALLAAKVSSEALPLVPFGEWFEQLEGRAKIADEHNRDAVSEELDAVRDAHLLVDSGGEQGFVVLNARLGNKGHGDKDEK